MPGPSGHSYAAGENESVCWFTDAPCTRCFWGQSALPQKCTVNLYAGRADLYSTEGILWASVIKPAPPSDHIPLARRCAFSHRVSRLLTGGEARHEGDRPFGAHASLADCSTLDECDRANPTIGAEIAV